MSFSPKQGKKSYFYQKPVLFSFSFTRFFSLQKRFLSNKNELSSQAKTVTVPVVPLYNKYKFRLLMWDTTHFLLVRPKCMNKWKDMGLFSKFIIPLFSET